MCIQQNPDVITFSNYYEPPTDSLEERPRQGISSWREDRMRDVPCGPRENSAPTLAGASVLHGRSGLMNEWGLRVKENRNK